MLRDLNVRSVRLLTNNPTRSRAWRTGRDVNAREPFVAPARAESSRYLQTKVERMGHTIDLALGHAANGAARNGHAPVDHYPVSEIAARASRVLANARSAHS